MVRSHHAIHRTPGWGRSGSLSLARIVMLVPGQLSLQLFLQDMENNQKERTIWHWNSIKTKYIWFLKNSIFIYFCSKTHFFFKMLLTVKITKNILVRILTSETSSSGWINLLVSPELVRVAGLLVTADWGLETVLLSGAGLETAPVVWV